MNAIADPVAPFLHRVGKDQHLPSEAGVTYRIDTYAPNISDRYWEIIGDFVRQAVVEAQSSTPYRAAALMSIVAKHTLWCWQTAGLPLERETIFNRVVIEEYVAGGCRNVTRSTRGNFRSQLLRVAEAEAPAHREGRRRSDRSDRPCRCWLGS